MENDKLLRQDIPYLIRHFRSIATNFHDSANAIQRIADSLETNSDIVDHDSIYDATISAVETTVEASEKGMASADVVSSTALSGSYNELWEPIDSKCNERFDARVIDNTLLIQMPVLPVATYRRNSKKRVYSARYPQLESLLNGVDLPVFESKPYLYILHVVPPNTNWRLVPDFDNYDVKWTIDTILLPYGGDNGSRYILIHSADTSDKLEPGTYIALGCYENGFDADLLRLMFEQLFSVDSPAKEYLAAQSQFIASRESTNNSTCKNKRQSAVSWAGLSDLKKPGKNMRKWK